MYQLKEKLKNYTLDILVMAIPLMLAIIIKVFSTSF